MMEWQGYDEQYEAMAQWLKEAEAQVRSETGLKPDLPAKQKQLDTFKVCADR